SIEDLSRVLWHLNLTHFSSAYPTNAQLRVPVAGGTSGSFHLMKYNFDFEFNEITGDGVRLNYKTTLTTHFTLSDLPSSVCDNFLTQESCEKFSPTCVYIKPQCNLHDFGCFGLKSNAWEKRPQFVIYIPSLLGSTLLLDESGKAWEYFKELFELYFFIGAI